MEEGKCGFCHTGDETRDICGILHKAEVDGQIIVAHIKCMQYSSDLSQYKIEEFGGFDKKEVLNEIRRGKRLPCYLCKKDKSNNKYGATSGCPLSSCRKTFHYYCAAVNPNIVAKRIPVWSSNEVVSLYRVFCSKAHKMEYMKNIHAEEDIFLKDTSDERNNDDEVGGENKRNDCGARDRTLPDETHAGHEEDHVNAKNKQTIDDKSHDDESGPESSCMSNNEIIRNTRSQYKALQERNKLKDQQNTRDNSNQHQDVSFRPCTCCCSELHNLKRRKLQLEIELLELKIRKVEQ